MTPTRAQIEEHLNRTYEFTDEGTSLYPGMSYEEGVQAALRWILGDEEDGPMEYDDDD